MKTHFTFYLFACFVLPLTIFGQSQQKPYVIHLSKENKYPGGIYAAWDSAAKKYNWYSAQNNFFKQTQAGAMGNAKAQTSSAQQIFHLVKDINNATDGGGYNGQPQVYNQHYAVLNGIAYFGADDGIHGAELWRSDGTNAGTFMVKDIEPGANSSGVSNITAANGRIYFSASTSANGAQPWISDGTGDGTHILKDISAYSYGGYPEMYTAVKDKVYFFVGRNQLWITDGTETGTTQIPVSYDNSSFAQPVAVGNKLFFTAYNFSYGRQLMRSDGTEDGTFLVTIIGYNYLYGPQQLTAYKKKLYFTADNGIGRKLYVSDGTANGTTVVLNDNNVLLPAYDEIGNNLPDFPLTILDNTFYFAGFDAYGTTGIELFKYSPDSTTGITLVKDITPGSDNTNIQPYEIVRLKDKVVFKVLNTDGSATLWKTKGTAASTRPITSFATVNNYNFYNLYSASGTLYFEAYTGANGFELWRSDGTGTGTAIVKDIFPGIYSSYPYFYTALNDGILFSARDEANGYELRKSDGSANGTELVKDVNQTSSGSSIVTHEITTTSGGVVFAAFDVLHGVEPFYSDGTDANTKIVADIFNGDFSSYPYAMKTVGDNVYFITNYDDNYIPALYRYNTSTKTLTKLFEVPPGYYIQNTYAVTDNGLLFFQLFNQNFYQYELWRTDGTDAGSYFLKSNQVPSELAVIGNTLFFTNVDQYYGNELFKTDGTVKGTKIFTDIYPGSGGSDPYSLIVYNNELYFGAYDQTYTTALWKANGTYAGTKKVAPIAPARLLYNDKDLRRVYCISNGLLYMNAFDYSTGEELWVTDGVHNGAKLVKDINQYYSSSINNMTDVNGLVCFSADDGINGNELWVSNGKPGGTKMLSDITPGSEGSNIYSFTAAGGKLYFIKDGALWMSSGADDKTMQVDDAGISGLSGINDLIASGNKLFFSGYTYQYGEELYEGDVSSQVVANNEKQNNAVAKTGNALRAVVLPNPVHSNAALQLFNAKNAEIVIMDNSGKIMWQQHNVNSAQLQIPSQQFAAGVYFIKISSNNEAITIKMLKAN